MAERTAAGMAVEAPALMAASTALRMKVAASSCRWVTVGFHVRRCIVNPASAPRSGYFGAFRRRDRRTASPNPATRPRGSRAGYDLVLIVVHDRSLVLLLIQLQLLVSIPSPQPKLSLILIYRNHWQNANRVSAHSESSHNPYTHACKRSHAALPVALFTPLSFRRSLPTVNAVRQLLPCWFASQARPSLLVSALDPSNHSRPRRTVSADCALPTYPVFVHAAPIHTATFTGFFGTAPYLCCAARPTYVPTLPSLPELRP